MTNETRGKAFVAWVHKAYTTMPIPEGSSCNLYGSSPLYPNCVPVIVTPILPDYPRVGETWRWTEGGRDVTIVSAPFLDKGKVWVRADVVGDAQYSFEVGRELQPREAWRSVGGGMKWIPCDPISEETLQEAEQILHEMFETIWWCHKTRELFRCRAGGIVYGKPQWFVLPL